MERTTMNERLADVVVIDSLADVANWQRRGYLTHALCRRGWCRFTLGCREHRLAAGDCMIIPQQSLEVQDMMQSDDFEVEVVYVTSSFIAMATPNSNYGTRGHLMLFENPIMHLHEEQQQVCALNFDYLRRRLQLSRHHFHREAMLNAVQCMIIDFFDFHAELYGDHHVSNQQSLLMVHFLELLDRGDARLHRDVAYYANELCVSSKHLSEVCRSVSGQSASYWIARYASLDISRYLRNHELSLEEVSDLFGFSSLNYFVRYVQKHLDISPSELRE